jgi:hypothetical protein
MSSVGSCHWHGLCSLFRSEQKQGILLVSSARPSYPENQPNNAAERWQISRKIRLIFAAAEKAN